MIPCGLASEGNTAYPANPHPHPPPARGRGEDRGLSPPLAGEGGASKARGWGGATGAAFGGFAAEAALRHPHRAQAIALTSTLGGEYRWSCRENVTVVMLICGRTARAVP